MKIFSNVVIAAMFVLYFFGIAMAITDVNKDTDTDVSESNISCVLQDAVMHDGTWFLHDEPAVFDEEACEVMSQIFRDEICTPVAAVAEYKDGCYLIHLD